MWRSEQETFAAVLLPGLQVLTRPLQAQTWRSKTVRAGLRWISQTIPACNRRLLNIRLWCDNPSSQLSRRSTEIMKKVESFQREKRKRAILLQKKVSIPVLQIIDSQPSLAVLGWRAVGD